MLEAKIETNEVKGLLPSREPYQYHENPFKSTSNEDIFTATRETARQSYNEMIGATSSTERTLLIAEEMRSGEAFLELLDAQLKKAAPDSANARTLQAQWIKTLAEMRGLFEAAPEFDPTTSIDEKIERTFTFPKQVTNDQLEDERDPFDPIMDISGREDAQEKRAHAKHNIDTCLGDGLSITDAEVLRSMLHLRKAEEYLLDNPENII